MKLLTKELFDKLPPLYSQEHIDDPIVVAKFFCPWNNWTWYAIEGEPQVDDEGNEWDYHFFGWVEGFDSELGYWSLNEMESVRGPGRLGIERDTSWRPRPLSEVKNGK